VGKRRRREKGLPLGQSTTGPRLHSFVIRSQPQKSKRSVACALVGTADSAGENSKKAQSRGQHLNSIRPRQKQTPYGQKAGDRSSWARKLRFPSTRSLRELASQPRRAKSAAYSSLLSSAILPTWQVTCQEQRFSTTRMFGLVFPYSKSPDPHLHNPRARHHLTVLPLRSAGVSWLLSPASLSWQRATDPQRPRSRSEQLGAVSSAMAYPFSYTSLHPQSSLLPWKTLCRKDF